MMPDLQWFAYKKLNYRIFLNVMSYPFLVVILPNLFFCQHSKPEVVSWLPSVMDPSWSANTEFIDTLCLSCSVAMMIQHGGLLEYMAPTEMMRNWVLLRNSGKFELIALDLRCWQEISI